MINKAYTFRIYPKQAQTILINKATGKGLTYGTCSARLPTMKKEFVWLKEVDRIAIQSSVRNLTDAYTRLVKDNFPVSALKIFITE